MRVPSFVLAVFLLASLASCKEASSSAPTNGKVSVTADAKGFSPSTVEVQKGAPLELVFTRTTDDTCATEVEFPELALKKELPLKKAVSISVPTGEARTLAFQCGMGMYKSKIVVQ